ncbi:MAG: hypothetical protein ACD_46C00331G0004 [uncultured bacterium]|nr:MAG: hypothetical protein ACD_46C00331G0004 [uncultured bacterium]
MHNLNLVRKIFINIISILLGSIYIVFLWCYYSIWIFEGFYWPTDMIGIFSPNNYYQKNVAPIFLAHGQEYIISDVNNANLNEYKDSMLKFRYPHDLKVKTRDIDYAGYHIDFFDKKNADLRCDIYIQLKGYGMGITGLPKTKYAIEGYFKSNDSQEDVRYLRQKNGNVFGVFLLDNKFTAVHFYGNKSKDFANIFDNSRNCPTEITNNLLETFEFIN